MFLFCLFPVLYSSKPIRTFTFKLRESTRIHSLMKDEIPMTVFWEAVVAIFAAIGVSWASASLTVSRVS